MDEKTADEKQVSKILIEDEMQKSFLDYSMAVIVSRALPDVRDGLKPVHRRILFAMGEAGFNSNKPFKKSARIVGDVLGRYHPHGDTAVYDSMVRMAQDFSLRYPLINGQGNFGSIDGDNAAAMRYCIAGDSLLLTDEGIVPIASLSKKKEANIKTTILSFNGEKNQAVKFFNSGKHNILEIETEQGYALKGSYNHPVLCWTKGFLGKPKLEWKLLEDIRKGDVVVLQRNISLFAKKAHPLHTYKPNNIRYKELKLPTKMNKDLAFLLGALVAEGSFHQNKIIFNNSDEKFYNKVKRILLSQFKGTTLYERDIKGGCKELELYHQGIVQFLINIGFLQERLQGKVIPFSVLRSEEEHIRSFLQGLFEGDGSVMHKKDKRHGGQSLELAYHSKSKTLIKQVKLVLLNLGITTTSPYRDKRNNCYKLQITGVESQDLFRKKINFFSEEKKKKLSHVKKMNASRMSKTDFVPYFAEYLRGKYNDSFLKRNNVDRYTLLKENFGKLLKLVDAEDKGLLLSILKRKFLFNKVQKITKYRKKENVYSVKVDSYCHSFVANGFINHNTEARLNKFAEDLLEDIKKETVDFRPNFDGSLKEPIVLPAKIPNLLVNGSTGIAVGMATNIPPHNLSEVLDGTIFLIDNPEATVQEIMQYIKGPDFPTGAEIKGNTGIKEAYRTGRGKVLVYGVAEIIEHGNKQAIIITEIPYMVNKAQMIEQMADNVRDKRITGISDIRDESDRDGMRIVIELKKDANANVVLNQLYKYTRLKVSFGMNMLALVNNVPKVLGIRELISLFIEHRKEVVTRRTQHDLKKAEERQHILDGLIIALDNIDSVVQKIKKSKDVQSATSTLMADYKLTEIQAKAILDMKLQKLSSLETENIRKEHDELTKLIAELKAILASAAKILEIIKRELSQMRSKYGDPRRTKILDAEEIEFDEESLIKEEEMIVTISHKGYIKRVPINTYKQQGRGGKGVIAAKSKDEDFIESVFTASTHSYILFFSNKGQVRWLKVYTIPETSRQAAGKAIVNLISIGQDERITAFVPVREFPDDQYLVLATKNGTVKKTSLSLYSRPRAGGIRGITLDDGDELIGATLTDGSKDLLLSTKSGNAIRFNEKDARPIGRTSKGVRGITLNKGDGVVALTKVEPNTTLLTITENGFGKRTKIEEYRVIGRAGKGVINIQCSERNGSVVAVKSVIDTDDVMIMSQKGIAIRIPVKNISVIGRNTQGFRIMNLESSDKVVSSAKIVTD